MNPLFRLGNNGFNSFLETLTSSQGRRGGGDPMAPKKPVEVPEFAKRASSIAKACRHPKHIQMSAFGSKARTN